VSALRLERVKVRGGDLQIGVWPGAEPVILALHGGVSSHLAWSVVARALGGAAALPRERRWLRQSCAGRSPAAPDLSIRRAYAPSVLSRTNAATSSTAQTASGKAG
jgi:hypothetical protein